MKIQEHLRMITFEHHNFLGVSLDHTAGRIQVGERVASSSAAAAAGATEIILMLSILFEQMNPAALQEHDFGLQGLDHMLFLLQISSQLFFQMPLGLLFQLALFFQLGDPAQSLILERNK